MLFISESLLRTCRLIRDTKSLSNQNVPKEKFDVEEDVEEVDDEEEEGSIRNLTNKTTSSSQHTITDDEMLPSDGDDNADDADGPHTTLINPGPPVGTLDHLRGHIALMRLLEPGERPNSYYRCARICGLDVHEGLLIFGQANFYVIDGYTLTTTHEIFDIEALPDHMHHEPIVPTTTTTSGTISSSMSTRRIRKGSSSLAHTFASNLGISGSVDQISGNQ